MKMFRSPKTTSLEITEISRGKNGKGYMAAVKIDGEEALLVSKFGEDWYQVGFGKVTPIVEEIMMDFDVDGYWMTCQHCGILE
jgi:hypothetical protein